MAEETKHQQTDSSPQAVAADSHAARQSRKRFRHIGFRVLAVALGLLPFIALEGVLRFLDLPRQRPAADPYVDLHNLRPLFDKTADGRRVIAEERLNLFRTASFTSPKPEGTYRIFALGGSTTQGEPYSTETAFAQWMGLTLQAMDPQRDIEVINCGGLSYASYRVRSILTEVLEYEPDLIVICTGHNEFLERRTYKDVASRSSIRDLQAWLGGFRIPQLVVAMVGLNDTDRVPLNATEMSQEVDALLDYEGGLSDFERGELQRDQVSEHFRWNLEQMILECKRANVDVAIVSPVSALASCPPFKSEVDPGLADNKRQEFERLWAEARSASQREAALNAVKQCVEIDAEHAGALYTLGILQLQGGDPETAYETLSRARDCDICPLRAPTAIIAQIQEVVQTYAPPFVDAQQVLEVEARGKLGADAWLVDHIHPSVEGHQRVGHALAQVLVDRGLFVVKDPGWQEQSEAIYRTHLGSLSEAYFQRAQQRLQGLQLWTQGRAKKTRPNGAEGTGDSELGQ